jgi:hypothetical protein
MTKHEYAKQYAAAAYERNQHEPTICKCRACLAVVEAEKLGQVQRIIAARFPSERVVQLRRRSK